MSPKVRSDEGSRNSDAAPSRTNNITRPTRDGKQGEHMWYVVQVTTGQEQQVCDLVTRIAAKEGAQLEAPGKPAAPAAPAGSGKPLLQECFVPTYETERKYQGEWQTRRYKLFPGYVIAVTNHVDQLNQLLRSVRAYTKILGNEDAFIPLDRAEMTFIDSFTSQQHRVVRMSRAVQEGETVRVTDGPLVGHEAWIRKVNKRKGTAIVEMSMFGRTLQVEIGLAVVSGE